MKAVRRVFLLFLILSALTFRSSAQERTSHSQNYQNCLYGLYGCDWTQLNNEEQQAVARAAHSRNYQNCLYGLYGCDPRQLTNDEQQAVARSAHSRNYENCLYGLSCNRSELTASEAGAVSRSAARSATVPAENSAAGPACEENGSCYGDISGRTGRPKTVHVHGYYRKDGTYVRGHYRSAPRRH